MLIGKVVGSVVSTRKIESLDGLKLLVVQVHDHHAKPTDRYVVAADTVGAGHDEMVLYATGSSARQTPQTDKRPCDASIMAILDSWDVEGQVAWRK